MSYCPFLLLIFRSSFIQVKSPSLQLSSLLESCHIDSPENFNFLILFEFIVSHCIHHTLAPIKIRVCSSRSYKGFCLQNLFGSGKTLKVAGKQNTSQLIFHIDVFSILFPPALCLDQITFYLKKRSYFEMRN